MGIELHGGPFGGGKYRKGSVIKPENIKPVNGALKGFLIDDTLIEFDGSVYGSSLAVDQQGNSYVGTSNGQVIKYDKNLKRVWKVKPATGSVDIMKRLIANPDGDIFCVPYSGRAVLIDSAGNEKWGAGGTYDAHTSAGIDDAGNIYSISGSGSIKKYSNTGTMLINFPVPANSVNDVYARQTGSHYQVSSSVKKVSDANVALWQANPGYSDCFAIDRSGNVYTSTNSGNDLSKWNSSGQKVWTLLATVGDVKGIFITHDDKLLCANVKGEMILLDLDGNVIVKSAVESRYQIANIQEVNESIFINTDSLGIGVRRLLRKYEVTGYEII